MTSEDKLARKRFILISLVQIGGTIVVLIALGIWYGNFLVPGGSIAIGLPLALAGLVVSFQGPKWLARKWRTPPAP